MAKKLKSDEQRFWEKVFPEPNSGCWLWGGALSGGYGRIGIGSRSDGSRVSLLATRFMLERICGQPGGDKHVLHKCDTKACVNPDHLYWGTHSQNMLDAYARGQKKPVRYWLGRSRSLEVA